jgi:MFS transporter, UMF1 family
MTDATPADVPGASPADKRVGGLMQPAGLSWAIFEFARNPYFMIVVTYVFPLYFAQFIIGDPVAGQAAVAEATKWAGIIGALTAPILGAMMDRGGARKPMMAVFIAMLAVSGIALWWSMSGATVDPANPNNTIFHPPSTGLGVAGTMSFLVLGFVGYTYSELMHNAMLKQSGRAESLARISGAGIGLGQLATALILAGVVVIALTNGALGGPAGEFALQRGTGPFVALWLLVFVVPFFIYVPDGAPAGGSWARAAKEVFEKDGKFDPVGKVMSIVDYVRGLFKTFPEAMKYLLACLIFKDGITALLAIGGVYSSGVLGWGVAEGGLYGIWASLFGAVGGLWLAPTLDRLLGARLAIMTQLALLCLAFLIALGTTKESILYGLIPSGHSILPGDLFNTLSDVFYLGIIAFVAALAAANIAASRHMMVMLAPKERLSEFFGLFALSSTATVWMGPMLIEIFTNVSKDQRIGFSPVLILLGIGLALMFALKKTTGAKGQVDFNEASPH